MIVCEKLEAFGKRSKIINFEVISNISITSQFRKIFFCVREKI